MEVVFNAEEEIHHLQAVKTKVLKLRIDLQCLFQLREIMVPPFQGLPENGHDRIIRLLLVHHAYRSLPALRLYREPALCSRGVFPSASGGSAVSCRDD